MDLGRPPKFKRPEDMQVLIEEYFKNEPVLTITGLVLHLGFADRKSFYQYEEKKAFAHTIKRARTMIENGYERILLSGGQAAGPIFALKNFGWTDKQELDLNNPDGSISPKGIDGKLVDALVSKLTE
jgi:hypothetical protein